MLLVARCSLPSIWAAVTVVTALVAQLLIRPTRCCDAPACAASHAGIPTDYNINVAWGLSGCLLYELTSLASTQWSVMVETRLLVPEARSQILPSLLLSIMFFILIIEMIIFATSPRAWFAHSVPSSAGPLIADRPVYTITYVEWLAIVPQLLTVAGHCALGRPLQELTRPVIVTNIYIVSAWMAQLVAGAALRWALVSVTFALYGWASWDVARWARAYFAAPPPEDLPGRLLRPCLALGVNAAFAVHAMVYLAAICGAITPGLERTCYLALDVGVKLAVCVAFVVIRAGEFQRTMSCVLRSMSTSNLAMISILRGSFDVLLPCTVDYSGACSIPSADSPDVQRLESLLGRSIAGASLGDLLSDTGERKRFEAYVKNTLKQVDGNTSSAIVSNHADWGCRPQPPVAQVMHCKMATCRLGFHLGNRSLSKGSMKSRHQDNQRLAGSLPEEESGTQVEDAGLPGESLSIAIHLSVVPSSVFTAHRREHGMVAAIRFREGGADMIGECSVSEASCQFGKFEAKPSKDKFPCDSEGGGTEKEVPEANVIVATLSDMTKLGLLFAREDDGASKSRSAGSQYQRQTLAAASQQTLAQLGKSEDAAEDSSECAESTFWPQAPELTKSPQAIAAEELLATQLQGTWHGTVSETLGGYEQTLQFLGMGLLAGLVDVTIWGQTVAGHYELNCEQEPYKLNLQVLPESRSHSSGSAVASSANSSTSELQFIPYIVELVANGMALRLCGPSGPGMQRPKVFEESGLCLMYKLDDVLPHEVGANDMRNLAGADAVGRNNDANNDNNNNNNDNNSSNNNNSSSSHNNNNSSSRNNRGGDEQASCSGKSSCAGEEASSDQQMRQMRGITGPEPEEEHPSLEGQSQQRQLSSITATPPSSPRAASKQKPEQKEEPQKEPRNLAQYSVPATAIAIAATASLLGALRLRRSALS